MPTTLADPLTGETFRYWTRTDWGARPPVQRHPLSSTREGVFYHHTVTETTPAPAVLRGVQSFHINGRGWFDIAYSFAVGLAGEWDGDLFELRGFNVQGGHTENMNSHSHAVVFIGDTRTDHISPKARRAALAIARVIERRHGGTRARCHGDVAGTDCPGGEARAWVHAGRPTFSPDPTPAPPAPAPQEDEDMVTLIVDGREGRLSAWLLSGIHKTWIPTRGYADLFHAAADAGHGGLGFPDDGNSLQGHGSPWIARLDFAVLTNPDITPEHLGGRAGTNRGFTTVADHETEVRDALRTTGLDTPDPLPPPGDPDERCS